MDKFDIKLCDIGSVLSRLEQCMSTTTAAGSICSDGTQQALTVAYEPVPLAVASARVKSVSGSQGFSIDSLNDLQLLDNVGADVPSTLRTIAETSSNTDTTVTASEGSTEPSLLVSADALHTGSANNGFGRPLDRAAYTVLPKVLESLQVQPCDITRIHDYTIGRGGFAEVYKVSLTNKGMNTSRVCAAKVNHDEACILYYNQQQVCMHILIHVCMPNTAATLLATNSLF
jgi:hypothetical protein